MANEQQTQQLLARFDQATSKLGERIRQMENTIKNQGLPADVEDRLIAEFEKVATTLEGWGKDPENPTPEVPETPTPQP